MSRLSMTASLLILSPILWSDPAGSATLALVAGELLAPEGANEGETVAAGTLIRTGNDGLVIVEDRWPSDVPTRDCVRLHVFGYGASYQVRDESTRGRCETTVPSNPGSYSPEAAFHVAETRYGDAKYDEPQVPERVRRSSAQWRNFDRWVVQAKRTFTGRVTSTTSRSITLRGARSSQRETFDVDANTPGRPASLQDWMGKSVRVTYQKRPSGSSVIRLNGPAVAEKGPDKRPDKPSKVDQPLNKPQPNKPQPSKPAPEAGLQNWECRLDLHQGDTGTLRILRRGDQVRGEIEVERVAGTTRIAGNWHGDAIAFSRTLSSSSHQPFRGITIAQDSAIRMGGRFANAYRGVWSADCAVAAPVAQGDRYEVVITKASENRIGMIKLIRALTGAGLNEAERASRSLPYTVKSNVSPNEAKRIAAEFAAEGVTVELRRAGKSG